MVDATPGFSECKEAMIRGFLTCYLLDKNYKLLDEKKQYENCKFMKFIQDNKITSFKELTAYENVKKFVKLVSNIHGVSYNNNGYEITVKWKNVKKIIKYLLSPEGNSANNDWINDCEISEDDSKNFEKSIQKLTDSNIENIEKILAEKEKEISQI